MMAPRLPYAPLRAPLMTLPLRHERRQRYGYLLATL